MAATQTSDSLLLRAARFVGEVACETLWPTRCALCDRPGEVLCSTCRSELPYIDTWKSCPHCGAPYGNRQCDFCNPLSLGRLNRLQVPFERCASALAFGEAAGTLVRTFKDRGEQRLARDLACMMVRYAAPSWRFAAVTYVPASKAAYRNRGFDHGYLLARELAAQLGKPLVAAFERPTSRDQRKLGVRGRFANLQSGFRLRENASSQLAGAGVLVVDDVFTTGATLCAACDALALVAPRVYCLTFARA